MSASPIPSVPPPPPITPSPSLSKEKKSAPPRICSLLGHRWLRMLISLLGGVLMAMAFLPYDISIIVWMGLLPLLLVLWTRPLRFWAAFGYGWIYGMGWYCVSFWWIHEVGDVFRINEWLFLGVAFVPLMSLYSLLPALWAGCAATLLRPQLSASPDESEWAVAPSSKTMLALDQNALKRRAWKQWAMLDMLTTLRCAIGLGCLWVCVEWLRAHGTLGFSWNSMGMALYEGLSLAQWAEFVGTAALSFLPVFFAVIFFNVVRRCYLHFKAVGKTCRPWDLYAVLLLVFGLFMGGLSLAQRYSPSQLFAQEGVLQLPVLAVQNNLGQVEKINMPRYQRSPLFAEYLEETAHGFEQVQKDTFELAKQHPELGFTQQLPLWVIWPESALPHSFWLDADRGERIADFTSQNLYFHETRGLPALRTLVRSMGGEDFVLFSGVDEYLIKGYNEGATKPSGMRNSMVIIEDDFASIRSVSKQHLMPFGEYIPLAQDIAWIGQAYSEITGTQTGDGIIPGEGTEPISVKIPGTQESISVIPAICYEDTVGGLIRQFARSGAQVIVNISNDAWFQHSACGEQQARNAAFRCIELRRPMVRAANQGVSCAIAPNGAFMDELRDEQGRPWVAGSSYAVLPVDKEAGLTIYARFGDWAVLLSALSAAAFSMIPLLAKRLKI